MGKVYTPQPIASETGFKLTLNNNLDDIETALEDVLSRSGATPNQMAADIDLNSNDLLNVNRIDAAEYYQNGQPLDFDSQLQEAKDYADAQDAVTLASANSYTDTAESDANAYTDSQIAALDTDSFLTKTADIVVDGSASRTLTAADAGRIIWLNRATSVVVTLPEDATEALPAGFQCVLIQGNAGTVTVTGEGSDVIVAVDNLRDTSGQGAAISVVKRASGTWWIGGSLA